MQLPLGSESSHFGVHSCFIGLSCLRVQRLLGNRTPLVQGAVCLGCLAGSGCRSLLSPGAAGAGCPAMSRHTTGLGHGSLPVRAQLDWDAQLVRGTGPSRLGCSCSRAQIPPGSGSERDASPSQFTTATGCGFLPVQDWNRMRVPPGSGCSRFGMRVPPCSGPERDADSSWFRTGTGCGFLPVQGAGGSGCRSLPVQD